MKERLLAVAPLLLAVLVYAAVAVPLRAQARSAADDFGQARRQRQEARAQLAPLERLESARGQAARVFAGAAAREGGTVQAVRRAVLGTLQGARVDGLRLAVRPGQGTVGATVMVGANGGFPEAVRLSGDLVAPGTGLILERVRLEKRPARGQVRLELSALALEARP